jgi:threonine aldolase
MSSVQTNMVFIDISGTGKTQDEILNLLRKNNLWLTPERYSLVRAVFHLDVSAQQVDEAIGVFRKLFA